MELKRIEIKDLEDEGKLREARVEAYEYGKDRGEASACGDRHGMLGGPKFDAVLKDYLVGKFNVKKDWRSIAEALPQIPRDLVDILRKGFNQGHRESDMTADD